MTGESLKCEAIDGSRSKPFQTRPLYGSAKTTLKPISQYLKKRWGQFYFPFQTFFIIRSRLVTPRWILSTYVLRIHNLALQTLPIFLKWSEGCDWFSRQRWYALRVRC